jgi:hypothetical protein
MSPLGTRAMTDARDELTPPAEIDMTLAKAERTRYIAEADSVGSIPPPASLKGAVKTGVAAMTGREPSLFLDKLGERLAFERSGTRLYEALITKYDALSRGDGTLLQPAADALAANPDGSGGHALQVEGESAGETLRRIRNEELEHFHLLTQAIETMGGDPTAQTPCADVIGTASMGFMQVLTDPRTTIAQCLNTMLAVELTDNAGWELLIQLAEKEGQDDLAGRFLGALSQEQEHLAIVKAWVTSLLDQRAGTRAV